MAYWEKPSTNPTQQSYDGPFCEFFGREGTCWQNVARIGSELMQDAKAELGAFG